MSIFAYDADGYDNRARECAKLADLAVDDMVREQILNLRRGYLEVAERLRAREGGAKDSAPLPH